MRRRLVRACGGGEELERNDCRKIAGGMHMRFRHTFLETKTSWDAGFLIPQQWQNEWYDEPCQHLTMKQAVFSKTFQSKNCAISDYGYCCCILFPPLLLAITQPPVRPKWVLNLRVVIYVFQPSDASKRTISVEIHPLVFRLFRKSENQRAEDNAIRPKARTGTGANWKDNVSSI